MYKYIAILVLGLSVLHGGLSSHLDQESIELIREVGIEGLSWKVDKEEDTLFLDESDTGYNPQDKLYLWAPEEKAVDIDDRSPWVPNWGWNPNKMA